MESWNFPRTRDALRSLEDIIKCDQCQNASGRLSFIGFCDHIFCAPCCQKYNWKQCPRCGCPVNVIAFRPVRQLGDIFAICNSVSGILDQYKPGLDLFEGSTGNGLLAADSAGETKLSREGEASETGQGPRKRARTVNSLQHLQRGDSGLAGESSEDSDVISCSRDEAPNEENVADVKKDGDSRRDQLLVMQSSMAQEGSFETTNDSTLSNDSPGQKYSRAAAATTKLNKNGETALHLACQRGDIATVRRILTANNSDPNVTDNAGWTPLHGACIFGRTDVVCCLLEAGSVIDPVGYDFFTPLHAAVQRGHVSTVQALITFGADVGAKTASGDTALTLAEKGDGKNRSEIIELLNRASLFPVERALPLPKRKAAIIGLSYSCLDHDQIRTIINMNSMQNFAPHFRHMPCFDAADTTHLVVAKSPAGRSFKYIVSVLKGKWIVTFDWITASLREGRFVDEEPFEVCGSTINEKAGGPKRARLNMELMKPGLFAGCRVWFWGEFPTPNLTLEQLQRLMELGQGTVEKRPPAPDDVLGTNVRRPYHAGDESWTSSSLIICGSETNAKALPRRAQTVAKAPLSWLVDCIDHFHLLPIPLAEAP